MRYFKSVVPGWGLRKEHMAMKLPSLSPVHFAQQHIRNKANVLLHLAWTHVFSCQKFHVQFLHPVTEISYCWTAGGEKKSSTAQFYPRYFFYTVYYVYYISIFVSPSCLVSSKPILFTGPLMSSSSSLGEKSRSCITWAPISLSCWILNEAGQPSVDQPVSSVLGFLTWIEDVFARVYCEFDEFDVILIHVHWTNSSNC